MYRGGEEGIYDIVNPEMYPRPGRPENTAIITVVTAITVAVVVYFFIEHKYSKKNEKGYHYILDRDKDGRITSIIEKPVGGE